MTRIKPRMSVNEMLLASYSICHKKPQSENVTFLIEFQRHNMLEI